MSVFYVLDSEKIDTFDELSLMDDFFGVKIGKLTLNGKRYYLIRDASRRFGQTLFVHESDEKLLQTGMCCSYL